MTLSNASMNTISVRRWLPNALAVACSLIWCATITPLNAEPGFPNRTVRIFVPYGPGGVGDLTMRLLAQKLSDNTGQQFVIENRPGAGGVLSAKAALSAPPTAIRLLVTGNGQAISMTLFKSGPTTR